MVQFTKPGFPWSLDLVECFYSADEFIVHGLSSRNRDSGLGAPLIAVTRKIGRFQRKLHVPATVFLRVSGDVRDWSAGQLAATLELYSAFDATQTEVNGRAVPLQTDTTAPMAQRLNDSSLWKLGRAQLLSPESTEENGLRPMQPHSPGRIPVVFVHGTASSPVKWAEMWNTLRGEPVLRKRTTSHLTGPTVSLTIPAPTWTMRSRNFSCAAATPARAIHWQLRKSGGFYLNT